MSPFPEEQRTGQTTKMEIKDHGWRFYFNLFSCPNTLYIPGTPHCTIRGFSEQPTSQNPQRRIQSEFPGTGPGTQTQTDTHNSLPFKHRLTSTTPKSKVHFQRLKHSLTIGTLGHHTNYFTSVISCTHACEQAL